MVNSSKSLKGMEKENTLYDGLVKSLKRRISVIPVNPGSGPGQANESGEWIH
jgi:hypothetical protein